MREAEADRYSDERQLVEESVGLAQARLRLYLKTHAGKFEVRREAAALRASASKRRAQLKAMAPEDRQREEIRNVFVQYDLDGSGGIDAEELTLLLKVLCIPASEMETELIVRQLDQDGSGEIDFEEFHQWFAHPDGAEAAGGGTTMALGMKAMLTARSLVGDWTGAALQKAAVTAVLKRHARQAAREATCRFRSQRPPRQA